ncbi:MAG: AMP-binding protein [Deltaproteobacteria bacterium]|nr:AMP-binding protein [Deltaproteobacteria bacterium]
MAETKPAERNAATGGLLGGLIAAVQNGLEIARFGGLEEREPSPHEIVAEGRNHRLRHYFPNQRADAGPAALLVPPLMLSAEIWDVAPNSSAVAALFEGGADPWVVDFGSPETEEGGLDRTLEDHVVAVSEAADSVRAATGRDVHLMGYSQGGMFCYQAAAYRCAVSDEDPGVASLVTFGSPVDMHRRLPLGVPTDLIADLIDNLSRVQASIFPNGIPSWATRLGFQLMDPVKAVQQRIDFAMQLADREALQQREGMRRFLGSEGWVAFPGPALQDAMKQLVAHNRLLQGGFVIDGHSISLASIECPILAFTGTTDSIAPAPTVRGIVPAAPQADAFEVSLSAGHFGLVVGSRSMEITWPTVCEWLEWREGRGRLPERVKPMAAPRDRENDTSTLDNVTEGLSVAFDLGRDLLGNLPGIASRQVGFLGRLTETIFPQLPRLGRLDDMRRDTAVSMAQALAEQAKKSPDGTFFLFEGRAHSYQAANERIDNIVRGLLQCGVRQGQHVGVLMDTRPSAVAATVALSRLGAVAVLLQPDTPLAAQLAVAPVDHLLADPERGPDAVEPYGSDVLVLGGGGDARDLGPGLIDMEAIDPDQVALPEWYEPDAGMAGEVGMILITGDGDQLGINRVTNRRWATSAYGTASACALGPGDTVYCCSPTYHATGIMVCVGGALVSGARLAMATPSTAPSAELGHVDLDRFWGDVRRYGVNVVGYSGSMLGALVSGPEHPTERSSPIQLFAGSGMPKGIWKRLSARFERTRVVEFFASTEGNAVLVNVTGRKIGSVGRPLPGGAELSVAAWDLDAGELIREESGLAKRCPRGEIGLLLANVDRARGEMAGRPMRGVFEAGDAWLRTGALVRVDKDGDYWLVDNLANLIQGSAGAVPALPIENVLTTELEFTDEAAVYGLTLPGLEYEIPAAALTLRSNAKLDPLALRRKIQNRLVGPHRPLVIRVLSRLPKTAGQRVRKGPLREEGLGLEAGGGETLWWAPGEEAYVPLSPGDVEKLIESVRNG